jgi:hypothetical protein
VIKEIIKHSNEKVDGKKKKAQYNVSRNIEATKAGKLRS